MKQETTRANIDIWYSPREISQMPGMPGTVQGVHKKAKREGWRCRKRLGVKGPAIEYNLHKKAILAYGSMGFLNEIAPQKEPPTGEHFEFIWTMAFRESSFENKKALIKQLMSHGTASFLFNHQNLWADVTTWMSKIPPATLSELKTILVEGAQSGLPEKAISAQNNDLPSSFAVPTASPE